RFVPPPYDPTIVPSPERVERVDLDPEPVARVPAVRPPVPEQYVTGSVPIVEIEGGWERVYRRRRRQTLTFLAGLVGVLVVGFIAWLTYAGVVPWPFGGTVSAAQNVCTHSQPLPPKKISVRVFNGSSRDGLAGDVAGRLKGLGFAVKATGNDPLETKIRTAVEIRHGENGDLAAATMVAYVVGKTKDVQDDRQDATIDLVLGPSFARLHTKAELKKSLAAVTSRLPMTCPLGVTPPSTATPRPSASVTPKARVTPRPTPKR
ncbi:MAG TPA: LytR C-terminal domain-containing protein, partial [Kineosporiaceae bacterium]|nr:LytR C-terminal domain-containing protein [Kineosporiaceae bacterium]